MYTPKLFTNTNTKEVIDFITENNFGILLNQSQGRIQGTHIPFFLDTSNPNAYRLEGHISRANPQWKDFKDNEEVLVVFNGPHAYISSSWYDHDNVPTWNYIAVHVYGKINTIEGETLLNSLAKLVNKHEAHSDHPVSINSMDKEMLEQNLQGIVGFEIEITAIQPTYKLSQNRDDKNHSSIVSELEKTKDTGSIALAEAMKKQRKNE